jgi:hypothetical protein
MRKILGRPREAGLVVVKGYVALQLGKWMLTVIRLGETEMYKNYKMREEREIG